MADNQFEGSPRGIDIQQHVENVGGRLSSEMELRIDKVQAVMDAKLDGVRHEADAKMERAMRNIWISAITTGLGVVGFLVAIAAYTGDRFEGGSSIAEMVEDGRAEQIERDNDQDARLDRVIELLEQQNDRSENRTGN